MNALFRLQVLMELVDRFTGPLGRVGQSLRQVQELSERVALAQGRMASALSLVGAGAALSAPLLLGVRAAAAFEDAFADVRKVVDAPFPALKALQSDLLRLTRTIPMTARELTEIAAAAGQSGIALSELVRFTADAARVGVAFGIAAGQAGDALAKLRNVLGLGQEGVMRLADAINHLSNNMAATAPEILEVVRRVGGMGRLLGLGGEQVAALSASLLALGTAPEVAATGLNALMQRLATAQAQPRLFQEALFRLGLTAQGLQAALRRDAAGAILDFLRRLRAAPDQLTLLSDLFGMEYADDIAKLVGSLSTLERAFALVRSPAAYGGSVLGEFANRSNTLKNQLTLLRNAVERLWIALGSTLLPVVTPVVSRLADLLGQVSDLLDRFPALRGAVVALGAALAGTLVVGGAAVAGLAAIGFASTQAQLGLAVLRAQLAALGGPAGLAQRAFLGLGGAARWAGQGFLVLGRAMLLSPLGLLATLLGGAALALAGAWRQSEAFRQSLGATFASLRAAFAPFLAELRGLGEAVAGLFRPLAGAVGASLGAIPRALDRVLQGVLYGLGFLVGLAEGLLRRLAPIFGEGLAGAIRVVRGFVDLLVGLFTLDLDRARQGALRIWEGLRALLSVPIRVGGVVVDTALAALSRLWGAVAERFPALARLGEGLGRAWSALVLGARVAFTLLRDVVLLGVRALGALFRGDFRGALAFAEGAWGRVRTLFSLPLRLGGVVWEGLRTSLGNALGFVRGLAASFLEAGRGIVQGLVRGIQSLALAPVNAVRDLGGKALNALKGLLGIRSPSRVFMELGAMTALGMAVGLQGMAPAVARAMEALVPPLPSVGALQLPKVPLPRLDLPAVRLPVEAQLAPLDLKLPSLAPTEAPGMPGASTLPSSRPKGEGGGQVVQVVRIERLELPGVRDADGFLEALKRLLIPYLEG